MSRHRLWTLALTALAACSSSASDPTSPNSPTDPKPPAPANIAGEWIDTTTSPGQPAVWHVTEHGTALIISDTTFDRDDSVYIVLTTGRDSATIVGDTILFRSCADCYADTAITHGDSITFVDVIATFVRGTWTPPTPPTQHVAPSDTLLAGTWISDSLATASCGSGIQQIALVLGKPFDSDSAIYQGYVYVRLCGEGPAWTQYTQNLGEETDSLLQFDQIQPVPPPDGPNLAPADHWWLKVAALDTLTDVTPDTINEGWLPPRFYRVDSLPGVSASKVRSTRVWRRRS